MTLTEILAAIRATPSKLEKRAILAANKDKELLSMFLNAVYNPRIQYGIKVLPKPAAPLSAVRDFGPEDIDDLMLLADGTLTGKKAKEMLSAKLAVLDTEGRELLSLVIGRDVKAGIAENSVLEVFPGMFYVPPYQRCKPMSPELKERFAQMGHFYVQSKSDGQFCYAIKRRAERGSYNVGSDADPRKAMSRAGSIYPQWLASHITYGMPEGYVAMGELLVVRDGVTLDRKTGNGILNSVLSGDGTKFLKTDSVRYLAWDMVTDEEFDAGESDEDYEWRYHRLCTETSLDRVPSWVVGDLRAANKLQAEHLARKEEGTVWKNPKMKWRDCQSGDNDMMKAKLVFEADYKITGAYEGKGKAAGSLGGFDLATSDDLIQFSVGSGFSSQQRADYWNIVQQNPEAFNGTIVAAEGNSIETSKSKPGLESVFLPIFIEIRMDKHVANTRDEVWAEFEAAKLGKEGT